MGNYLSRPPQKSREFPRDYHAANEQSHLAPMRRSKNKRVARTVRIDQ
jgi:hypothetical protein